MYKSTKNGERLFFSNILNFDRDLLLQKKIELKAKNSGCSIDSCSNKWKYRLKNGNFACSLGCYKKLKVE